MDSPTGSSMSEKQGAQPEHTVNIRDVDVAAGLDSDKPLDPNIATRIRRKIDWHIMPFMCIMYLMSFADKMTLAQSNALQIKLGAHLNQNQFNWLGTIFYLSYLVFECPQNIALQQFPVGKWMSINMFIWAVALLAHAACKSFGALFAVRFIMGACEGAITPGFMIVTSMFYTRAEQTKRVGYWFLMNGFAIIFLSLVGFGLMHTNSNNFQAWQWLMIITGLITLVTSVLFWFFFPDSPITAHFLTLEERALAVQRIKPNQSGIENKRWKLEQFIETLQDPKVWVMALFAAISNLVNSLTAQRPSISSSPVAPPTLSLLGCVDGAVEILTIWLGVTLASQRAIGRGYAAVLMFIPGLVGAILVNTLPSQHKVGLLISYWISIFIFTPFVILLGSVGSIVAGHTKRITTTSIILCGYAIGNTAGPFMWKPQYQPRNHVPWAIIVATIVPCAILTLGLRYMLHSENKRRDGEQRDETYDNVYLQETEDGIRSKIRIDKTFLDLTDIQNRDFRYTL